MQAAQRYDLVLLVEARQIDIGMAEGPDVRLRMHAVDVTTVVKHLVDNAIRYALEGGRVDLSARVKDDGNVLIEVEDNGPGIPASERVRVL
ncbi:MAG: ATP-binding protein [Brachymonas sp.]